MRCEIVTPAGRKRYLEILYLYLKSQKSEFDIWQLWINTADKDDIEYMNELAANHNWIKLYPCTVPVRGNDSISSFFGENVHRDDTIYIRLDDDIVYLSPNFIADLKAARLKNPLPFLVYPNIINNAPISHLHFRNNLISHDKIPQYNLLDDVGWNDPLFAEQLHNSFIKSIEENNINLWRSSFREWNLFNYDSVSINCICWFGTMMKNIQVGIPEEQFLSHFIPAALKLPNLIVNQPICAHYAFYTQRDHIDTTNILQKYKNIALRTANTVSYY